MAAITKNFPLLTEIDEQINFDNLDWNKNAFETLLVSLFLRKKTTSQSNENIFSR